MGCLISYAYVGAITTCPFTERAPGTGGNFEYLITVESRGSTYALETPRQLHSS
jgi:hypothetical protein